MNGNKGIYELVYFVKDSKSLERFKNQAKSFDSYTMSKKDAEIEQLVRQASLIGNLVFSFGKHSRTVRLFMEPM